MTPDKPVVGVMSPLPDRRPADEPDDDAHGPARRSRRGCFFSELKRDFTVKHGRDDRGQDSRRREGARAHPPEGASPTRRSTRSISSSCAAASSSPSSIRIGVLDRSARRRPDGHGRRAAARIIDKLLKAWGLTFDSTQGRRRSGLRRPHPAGPRSPRCSR